MALKFSKIKIIAAIYVLILVGIVFVADIRGTNYFAFLQYIPYGDKVGHFCLMGTFSLLLNLALWAREVKFWRVKYLLGSLIVFAVVATEEFSQMFISGRTFDWDDLLCDAAGIFLFGELARLIYWKTLKS